MAIGDSGYYIGNNNPNTNTDTGNANYIMRHNPAVFSYACPDISNPVVTELAAIGRYVSDNTKHVQIGLYNEDSELICASGAILVNNSSDAWIGVSGAGNTSPANVSLTPNANYYLAILYESNDTRIGYTSGVGDNLNYGLLTYSSGLPNPWVTKSYYLTMKYCLRCGIDSAAASGHPSIRRFGGIPGCRPGLHNVWRGMLKDFRNYMLNPKGVFVPRRLIHG